MEKDRLETKCKVNQIASFLKLSNRRIQMLVKEGIIPRLSHGNYELIPCIHAYIEHLKGQICKIHGCYPQSPSFENSEIVLKNFGVNSSNE